MLKLNGLETDNFQFFQPPSGGCVLKQRDSPTDRNRHKPAAFGRLCVETINPPSKYSDRLPAAFGRLCVETLTVSVWFGRGEFQPPSGGCVLKPVYKRHDNLSEYPAAFGRLCVETKMARKWQEVCPSSRLRAAVC